MTRFPVLTEQEIAWVARHQIAQQNAWRNVPVDGRPVECAGLEFIVLPGVFPPKDDSALMIETMRIERGTAVLDMGTGSGVLAVFAALRGAGNVVAVDINPNAVRAAALNAERHGVRNRIEPRLSDGFTAITAGERFDLIIANLPGRNATARDLVEAAQWDTDFRTHRSLFAEAPAHLKPTGSILMSKANYPELNDVVELATASGFTLSVVETRAAGPVDPRTYYLLAFSRP